MSDTRYRDAIEAIEDLAYDIIERIHTHKTNGYKIVVAGSFSSGKSTLINAIAGRRILPCSSSETTVNPVRIYGVSPYDSKYETAELELKNGEKKNISVEEINVYGIVGCTPINPCDIEHINVYTDIQNFESSSVIVDTPSYNILEQNSTIRDEIRNADCIIYCFNIAQPGAKSEFDNIQAIKRLAKNDCNILWVLNKKDWLRGEDTEEYIVHCVQSQYSKLFGESFDGNNIICVSSYQALVAKDKSIKKLYEDMFELSDGDRRKLWEESGFEKLIETLTEMKNERQKNTDESFLSEITQLLTMQKMGDKNIVINNFFLK